MVPLNAGPAHRAQQWLAGAVGLELDRQDSVHESSQTLSVGIEKLTSEITKHRELEGERAQREWTERVVQAIGELKNAGMQVIDREALMEKLQVSRGTLGYWILNAIADGRLHFAGRNSG